ncbi:MAG: hypothetical protein NTV92_09470, partial [Candidatus Bipolaricaulota bacterium]|nr:hypothetical protein [Candidatus Bipolaricaulota bacterium]
MGKPRDRQDAKKALRERSGRAFLAADGAEHVLPYFENAFPDDDRPRKAIETTRAWARGEIRAGEALAAY